ncbi:unnamed protein product, partial [Meganyctiphanes norvegica]
MSKVLSFNNAATVPIFIKEIELFSQRETLFEKEFFPGACFTCAKMSTDKFLLHRCAGCQLVSYCNKKCQKTNWSHHKILCKIFPVENGKSVIVRKAESASKDYTKFVYSMQELQFCVLQQYRLKFMQASRSGLKDDISINWRKPEYGENGVDKLFLRRNCNSCDEVRPQKLFHCRCCAVSYCSTEHLIQDTTHWFQECDPFYACAMANWYLTTHQQLKIPKGLLKYASLDNGLKFEKVSKLFKYLVDKSLEMVVNLVNERLAFPLTIHHALKKLKLGDEGKTISKITSLSIHIVHGTPMLDPRMWEFLLHQLPNLIELNLTFIGHDMKLYNKFNSCLPVERCSDCKGKHRVITYNIQPMQYHEYFSSDDYVQPDVVAVFNIMDELYSTCRQKSSGGYKPACLSCINYMHTERNIGKANDFTSQRDMTYNKHTIVILTSCEEESLKACIQKFNASRPIKLLLPVQENPVRGFSTVRKLQMVNINHYICC